MKRRPVVLAVVSAVASVWALSGCTVRGNFDGWISRQGVKVIYAPVPCGDPAFTCGSSGGFNPATKTIYIDPVIAADFQNRQNAIDPSITVLDQIYYHEFGHVADWLTGFAMEGATRLGFEHAAQCVMQLVTGRSFTFFTSGVVYWVCPPDHEARARWILTANHII